MKKSNWREDLHAPVAVKKVLKEYIQTLPLVAATSKIVPFTTTAKAIGTKGFFSTTAGKLTTGAAVGQVATDETPDVIVDLIESLKLNLSSLPDHIDIHGMTLADCDTYECIVYHNHFSEGTLNHRLAIDADVRSSLSLTGATETRGLLTKYKDYKNNRDEFLETSAPVRARFFFYLREDGWPTSAPGTLSDGTAVPTVNEGNHIF